MLIGKFIKKRFIFYSLFYIGFFIFLSFFSVSHAATESIRLIRQDCTGYTNCYTSLSAWEAAQNRDLVASDEIAVAQIDGQWTSADTARFTIDGWTTGPNNYIKIYTTPTARHSGKYDNAKYRIEGNFGWQSVIQIVEEYVRIDGLQFKHTESATSYPATISLSVNNINSDIRISNNIFRGDFSLKTGGNASAINQPHLYQSVKKIWNNIFYDYISPSAGTSIVTKLDAGSVYLYNNTAVNCGSGFVDNGGGANVTFIAKNNIVQSCADGFAGTDTGSDYNISSIANDAIGANSKNSTIVSFVDATNKDFHLSSSDTSAKDFGANLSADSNIAFSDDIDGNARPIGANWDIGADETSGGVSDTQAPSVPTNLSATAVSSSQINLSWTASTDNIAVTGYKIYRNSVQIGTTVSTSYSDTGLSASTNYTYTVSAYDAAGNNSANSTSASATTQATADTIPPIRSAGSPSGTLIAGTISTTISLTTDENATCKYSTTAGTAYSSMPNTFSTTGGTTHSTTISGLTDGTSYIYYVRCQDTSSNASTDDYLISFLVAVSGSSTRHVGSGQIYSTIQSAINAAVAGDTVVVHTGTYNETVTINKSLIVQRNPGDSPLINGKVVISSGINGVTVDGFTITGGAGPGVYSRNSNRITIKNNTIYGMITGSIDGDGIQINSANSLDNTYENGTIIDGNTIHDNTVDGLKIGGQYYTISNNYIYNNITTDYAATHPDGIQLNAGPPVTGESVQHAKIFNNTIKNHTQNIFTEGSLSGVDSNCLDIHIYNNVLYMDDAVVNGVDMNIIIAASLNIKYSKDVFVYNNTLGRAKGLNIRVNNNAPGTIHIKNNIISNSHTSGSEAVGLDVAGDIADGELDYNLYNMSTAKIIGWAGTSYTTLTAFKAGHPTQEVHGLSANPLLNSFPTPTLQSNSPAIDKGANLGSAYNTDKNNTPRPQGTAWDIGAYEYVSGAKTYYIDFVGGNDANNGTSITTPWKHSPGDTNATGVPLATALTAGDKVIFKGGVVYSGIINVNWSGASGNPITYDGNSAGAWGTGKAIVDGQDTNYYGFYRSSGLSNVSITNFEIRNMARNPASSWINGGVYFPANTGFLSNIKILNNYIHHIGYWRNDAAYSPSGSAIQLNRCNNCLVDGNEMTKTGGAGVGMGSPTNTVVSNNKIYQYIKWGIDITGDFGPATGNIISDNVIYDFYLYDSGFWPGVGDTPHTDFVFIRQGGGTRPSGNIVERNLFYNNYNFTNSGGTAMIFLSYADDTTIRNNVFINPHSYRTASSDWTSSGTKFHNNTIYAPRTGGFEFDGTNTDIRNNIMVVSGSAIFVDDYLTNEPSLVSNSNKYWINTASQGFVEGTGGSGINFYTLSQWQATRGFDSNSTQLTNISDFKFIDTSGYPLNNQNMNLRLNSGSPAINAGVTLTGFTADKDGTPRPQGTAWDIGAYESVGGASDCSLAAVRCVDDTAGVNQEYSTIQAATNAVNAGDTILVFPGTYNERITFPTGKTGTVNNKITFKSQTPRAAFIKGFNTTNANYLRIEGFDITHNVGWWLGGGIWLASNNVEIVDNYFHDIPGPGISASWQRRDWANIFISGNKMYKVNAGIFASGINWLVENNEVERLYRFDFVGESADGVDADYSRFFGENITFRNNYFHGTSQNEIGTSHTDGFQTFVVNQGEYFKNVIIERNIVRDWYSQGMMLEGKTGFSDNLTVRNNIFADAASWGIAAVGINNIQIYNNDFVNMVLNGVGFRKASDGTPTTGVVQNNIFYNGGSNYWKESSATCPTCTLTGGYNIITKEKYPYYKESTDLIGVDPLFVNVSGYDFHLQSSSPAKDKGIALTGFTADKDNISRPQGAAWDIGAYEYVSGVVSDTTAPSIPTALSAIAISSSQINLSWTASTDNIAVTGYKIYRNSVQIGTTANTSYSDTGLSASTNYTYTVSAYDAAGNVSGQSGSISATTQAVPSSPCVESWTCGNWSDCSNSSQARTCTDSNNCGTVSNKPVISQSCSSVIVSSGGGGGGGGGGSVISNPPPQTTLTSVQIRDLTVRELEGGLVSENSTAQSATLFFEAMVFDSNNKVRLEIELRKAGEQFVGVPTFTSEYVDSGKTVSIARGGLVDGFYRFKARTRRYSAPGTTDLQPTSDWLWFGAANNTHGFTLNASQAQISQSSQSSTSTKLQYYFKFNLYLGLKINKDVESLQKVLNIEGVYPENIVSGNFGPKTQKAVISFQKKYNISPAIGRVGPLTRIKLNELYAPQRTLTPTASTTLATGKLIGPFAIGMRSEQVKLLQLMLAKDKTIYPEATITGYYGNLTIKAVKRFQEKYNIEQTGLAGPKTRAKLNEVYGR